jgi:hypothetical protein
MTANNAIVRTVERKQIIMQASPQRRTAMRQVAENLSRRTADMAVCELLNEALSRLVELCFEQDGDYYCNLDPVTWKIEIALPFGRNGHKQWGLRPSEANALRRLLFDRQYAPGLFLYDKTRRCWRINLHDFGSYDLAMRYLTRQPVGVAEYRAAYAKR